MTDFIEHSKNQQSLALLRATILNVYQSHGLTRSGLEEARQSHANVIAMARIYQAIRMGTLTVNGLPPDANYPLATYLMHGGRVRFDLTALNTEQLDKFRSYIFNQSFELNHLDAENYVGSASYGPRKYATHRRAGKDASGSPAEIKSLVWGAIVDFFTLPSMSKHWYIDLPIGGNIPNAKGELPKADGRWGHLYIHQDADLIMVGIEASGYAKTNKRTNEFHSRLGSSGKLSPFMAPKINSTELHNQQIAAGYCPLSTKGKYNWATIKITPQNVTDLCSQPIRLASDQERNTFVQSLLLPPPKAVVVKDNAARFAAMKAWQTATKKINVISKATLVGGVLMAAVGVALMFAPIPGVAQFIGGFLLQYGVQTVLGGALATGALGFAVGAAIGKGIGKYQAANALKALAKRQQAALISSVPADQDKMQQAVNNHCVSANNSSDSLIAKLMPVFAEQPSLSKDPVPVVKENLQQVMLVDSLNIETALQSHAEPELPRSCGIM